MISYNWAALFFDKKCFKLSTFKIVTPSNNND